MEQGIAEKPWIDLHATLHSDSQQLYEPPHTLPELLSDLLHDQPTASTAPSLASHKLTPAARKASTTGSSASLQPYPTSAVFHCKFAYDASGYLLLVSDWVRVWCHRATAEQVQLEKAEFAQQVALPSSDDTITRCVQPLLTGPHNQRQHTVSFQPAADSAASPSQQPVLLLTSSMEMGVFRLQWRFDCRPFLTPLHQSALLLHLTVLPQQSMVNQLHAQLTAVKANQSDASPRVKEEAKDRHEPSSSAGRIAASQVRSQHVPASQQQQQARSPSPVHSPPATTPAAVVKAEDNAVPTLDSLYEQSMRASQSGSQSQTDEPAVAEAVQPQVGDEQKEVQKGADGEGYWDDVKQEWVQGEKEKERAEKAKHERLLAMQRKKKRKGFG